MLYPKDKRNAILHYCKGQTDILKNKYFFSLLIHLNYFSLAFIWEQILHTWSTTFID